MEGGGIRDACSGAVGLLCSGWLSRFPFSMCKRRFQDLLSVRPSSLFTLCGCISISIASSESLQFIAGTLKDQENVVHKSF